MVCKYMKTCTWFGGYSSRCDNLTDKTYCGAYRSNEGIKLKEYDEYESSTMDKY